MNNIQKITSMLTEDPDIFISPQIIDTSTQILESAEWNKVKAELKKILVDELHFTTNEKQKNTKGLKFSPSNHTPIEREGFPKKSDETWYEYNVRIREAPGRLNNLIDRETKIPATMELPLTISKTPASGKNPGDQVRRNMIAMGLGFVAKRVEGLNWKDDKKIENQPPVELSVEEIETKFSKYKQRYLELTKILDNPEDLWTNSARREEAQEYSKQHRNLRPAAIAFEEYEERKDTLKWLLSLLEDPTTMDEAREELPDTQQQYDNALERLKEIIAEQQLEAALHL
jgi:hypothetical protein